MDRVLELALLGKREAVVRRVARRDDVIEASMILIPVPRVRHRLGGVPARVAGDVRHGNISRQLLGYRGLPRDGNLVIRKRNIPAARIHNLSRRAIGIAQRTEVSLQPILRWIEGILDPGQPLPQTFVVAEEEELVPYDPSAHGGAEVVLPETTLPGQIEKVARIQPFVSQELEHGSMKRVRAALERCIYGDRAKSELGAEGVALHFELLNRVYRRPDAGLPPTRGSRLHAIQKEADEIQTLPGNRSRGILAAGPTAGTVPRSRRWNDARRELGELHEVSPVQRQILNRSLSDHLSERRVLAFQKHA